MNEIKIKNKKFVANTRIFIIALIILFNLFIFPSSASPDDFDNDGLNSTHENWWATDPYNVDSDGDGVWDGDEVSRILSGDRSFGTPFFKNNVWNNLSIDGDRDGVPDLAEIYVIRISPDKQSTDGDKYDDGQELFGISPNGILPGYVTSPGDNVFVAAYPEINIDISESISIVNIQEITFETRNSTVNTQGYSTSNTDGTMMTMGTSSTHSKNSWIDINNKEADINTQNNYYETITNTEENYFKGYTEGKRKEIETGETVTDYIGAKVGAEYGLLKGGASVSAEVSADHTKEISSSNKNIVETGIQESDYNGISVTKTEGGEELYTRIRETSVTSGSGEESSFTTSISRSSYHETTVTNSNSIASGYEWGTATTTNTGHAADLVFTYFIENAGTDIALEVNNIVFNIFVGDEDVPITYYASVDMGGSINNLKPSNKIQFSNTAGSVPLSLQQLRKIDEGVPIRIILADYSYGLDELSYENAWGGGVLFEIDDGVFDGDETIDKYMIPAWGQEKYVGVLSNVIPVTMTNGSLVSINNQPITEWSWWDIYLQKSSLETKFLNESSYAKTRVFLRYNKDSDRDYYTDRTEINIGTDPFDNNSHPTPILSGGAFYENNIDNTTIKLKLTNAGNYEVFGVEARLFSLDSSTIISKEIVGGGGRLKPGQTIFLQEEDMFIFSNNTLNYTEPVIVVSYNDPQGHHNFITPIKLNNETEEISQYANQMIYEPKSAIDTYSEYTYNQSNPIIINFDNPTNSTIENAHVYIAYQDLLGNLINITDIIVDLYPGKNSFFNWWIPSGNLQNDMVGNDIKVVSVVTDYQGIMIDEDVEKIKIISINSEVPKIEISHDFWNFNSINQGQPIFKTFTVFNTGKSTLCYLIHINSGIDIESIQKLTSNTTTLVKIPSGSSQTFTIKLNTNETGSINTNIVIHTNDPTNPVINIPITGNVIPKTESSGIPDLSIQYDDIVFSNNSPTENETIVITANTQNIGNSNADNIIVKFFNGDPDNGGMQIGPDQVLGHLNSSENVTVQMSWEYNSSYHLIYVVVDSEDFILESDETNNIAYNLLNPQENIPVSILTGNDVVLLADNDNYLMNSNISIEDNAILVIRNSTLIGINNNIIVNDSGMLLLDGVKLEINKIYAENQSIIDMRNTNINLTTFNTTSKKINIINSYINSSGANGVIESDGEYASIYIQSNGSFNLINSSLISKAGDGGVGNYHSSAPGGNGGNGGNSSIHIFSDKVAISKSSIMSVAGNGEIGGVGSSSGYTAYHGGNGGKGGFSDIHITAIGIYSYSEGECLIISNTTIFSIGASGGEGNQGGLGIDIGGTSGHGGDGGGSKLLIESNSFDYPAIISNTEINVSGGMGGLSRRGVNAKRYSGSGSYGGNGGHVELSVQSNYELSIDNVTSTTNSGTGGNGGSGGFDTDWSGTDIGGGGGNGGDGSELSILINSISDLSISNSALNNYGGNGNNGGSSEGASWWTSSIASAGNGGNGAPKNIIIKSDSSTIISETSIDVDGSLGGNGGSLGSYSANVQKNAGAGGLGGYNTVYLNGINVISFINSSINIKGRNGGTGGYGNMGDPGTNGGQGGSGNYGKIILNSSDLQIKNTYLTKSGGDGGTGGNGGNGYSGAGQTGGHGGKGGDGGLGSFGNIIIKSSIVNISNTFFVEQDGDGGNGGIGGNSGRNRNGGNGGKGGDGDNNYLYLTSDFTNFSSSSIFINGGVGGNGGYGGTTHPIEPGLVGQPGGEGINGSGLNDFNTKNLWIFDSILNQPLMRNDSANIVNTSLPSITANGNATINIYWWLTTKVKDINGYPIIKANVLIANHTSNDYIKNGSTNFKGISRLYLLSKVITTSGVSSLDPYIVNVSYTQEGNITLSTDQIINMSGNQAVNFTLNNIYPDLSISYSDISFYPNLFAGTNITVNATINNNGVTGASNIIVQFFAGDPAIDGKQIGTNQTIGYLASGESQLVHTNGILQSDTNSIYVRIDPVNNIPESNEDNNVAFSSQDLLVKSISYDPITPVEGDIVTLNATILNNGSIDSNNLIVSFYDGNNLIGHDAITTVIKANGGNKTAQILWNTNGKVGIHDIYVKTDPFNGILEYNESNNNAYETLEVLPISDLIPINLSFSPENPTNGEKVNITVLINNTGASVSTFNISFFDNGTLIGNSSVYSMSSRSNNLSTIAWTATTGVHNLSATVDSENSIIELNENNNINNEIIFTSIDEIYVDSGNTTSDKAYESTSGYGYLDGIIYNSWGNEPHKSTRYEMDGEIQYRFDNLDPVKNYHLDLNFYEEDGQNRVEEIWIDGIYVGSKINITDSPKWESIKLPSTTYEDHSVIVSIKRSGLGDAIINEMKLQQVESIYIDCGNQSDNAYNSSSGFGYVTGMEFTAWGNQPHQTIRYAMDEDIVYRFDNLDSSKNYQFNIVFYEADNQDRIEEVWIDGMNTNTTVDMSDGDIHLVIVDIPYTTYNIDGTINLNIKRTNGANTIVSGITLEENTIQEQNANLLLSPVITILSPKNGHILTDTTPTVNFTAIDQSNTGINISSILINGVPNGLGFNATSDCAISGHNAICNFVVMPPYLDNSINTITINVSDNASNSAAMANTTFEIKTPDTITGTVTNETGSPIAGAMVKLTEYPQYNATTASDGSYTISSVPEGIYNITAKKDPEYYSNSSIVVDLISGNGVQDIELATKPTGTISGSVTNAS